LSSASELVFRLSRPLLLAASPPREAPRLAALLSASPLTRALSTAARSHMPLSAAPAEPLHQSRSAPAGTAPRRPAAAAANTHTCEAALLSACP